MELILNGKRSTLEPSRANQLSFIHDNYVLYFDLGEVDGMKCNRNMYINYDRE